MLGFWRQRLDEIGKPGGKLIFQSIFRRFALASALGARKRLVRRFPAYRALVAAGIIWFFVVAAGFLVLAHEEFTPVGAGASVALFPRNSALQLAPDRVTLLLFAHPHCPCTRASLHELDGLLAETGDKVSAIVLFTIPKGVPAGWEQGDLFNLAKGIPGLRVICDKEGMEARRFNVEGSGHSLLYSSTGKLLFSGGITPSRGHEGDNVGRSAVVSLIRYGHSNLNHAPAFGCSLF
jgi:hypothetical protein